MALLSYEFVSIFWWAGCWAGCYHVQPGKFAGRLLPLAQREKTGAVFTKALGVAEAQVAKATWISRLPLLKTAERPRLVVRFFCTSTSRRRRAWPSASDGSHQHRFRRARRVSQVSLAESLVLRGAVKPISLAAKLWLSYNVRQSPDVLSSC